MKTKKNTTKTKMSKKRRNRLIRNGVIASILIIGVVAVAIVFNLVYGIIQDTADFEAERLMRYEPFTILDSNDNEIYSYGAEPVLFEDIPQVMVDAIIAVEDSRYYEHNGFDIPRIIKALFGNLTSGSIQSGASTITQQVIKKNYYPDEERTYQRKIGEIFLAIQADSEMDKETILTCYLNTIDYGVGIGVKGIKSAADYYFDKEVSELTLPEAAYLAGVVNAPSAYDAFYNLDLATKRRNVVLDLMELHGYITEEECDLAKSTKLENQLVKKASSGLNYEQYQAYIDAVLEEAIDILYADIYTEDEITANKADLTREVLNKSITIHTYMNAGLQNHLESQIATGKADGVNFYGDGIEIAGAVIDNYNGRIAGLLGGRDYIDYTLNSQLSGSKVFGFNRATTAKVSPGSSLKPLVAYLPGIEFLDWPTYAGITDDTFSAGGVTIHNWDRSTHGVVSFHKALQSSWNITAAKALKEACQKVGEEKIIQFLNGMGLTVNDINPDNSNPYDDFNYLYAIGAWAEGVTMVQEAGAYATLVNGGNYYEPHTINYIEFNNNGEKIMIDEEIQSNVTRAISEDSAYMVRELMKAYTPGSFAYVSSAANACGISVGGKTGTATNDQGNVKGYIFAAFTSDYSMTFWTGYDSSSKAISSGNQQTPRAAAGSTIRYLHKNGSTHKYTSRPSNVKQATVQLGKNPSDTYYLANEYTPDAYKVTGYYKTSNPPAGSKTPSISAVSEFTAQSINDTSISVSFAQYPDKSQTEIPKEYADGKKLNPDYMYGKIVYVAVVRDAQTGEELFKQISDTPSFVFNYNITKEVTVCGRYEYSLSPQLHSDEVTVNVKPLKVPLPAITFDINANGSSIIGGSTTSNNAVVSVTSSYADNIVTITVSGPSYTNTKTYTGNCSMTLKDLSVGTYTVTITEEDANQTNKVSVSSSFSVVNPTPPPPPVEGADEGE